LPAHTDGAFVGSHQFSIGAFGSFPNQPKISGQHCIWEGTQS